MKWFWPRRLATTPAAVPVCILGVLDTEWGGVEANRETFDETTLCPEGVARRVHHAKLHQCSCGGLHGAVPQWVRETLRGDTSPGLRLPPRG